MRVLLYKVADDICLYKYNVKHSRLILLKIKIINNHIISHTVLATI